MSLQLPPKIPILDILRNMRVTVNTIIETLLVDSELTENGFKLLTDSGDSIEIDLSTIFLKRKEYGDLTVVPPASEEQSGRIAIVSDQEALEAIDDTKAMTAAKTLLLLLSLGLPRFDTSKLKVGELLQVQSLENGLLVQSQSKLNWINSLTDAEAAALCAKLPCASGTPKTIDRIQITGPNSIDVKEIGKFFCIVFYTDGTNAEAVGAVFSVVGVGATINATTGELTGGPDVIIGGPYTVKATYKGQTYAKGTTFTTAATQIVVTGKPKYFSPIPVKVKYDGSLDTVKCRLVSGWIVNLDDPNTPAEVDLFLNGGKFKRVKATIFRDDVSQVLGIKNAVGHIYGFEIAIPDEFSGQKLTAELRPISGTNTLRYSPKTSDEICLDLSNLINVAKGKSVTASSTENNPTLWSPSHLTDETSDLWTSACVGVNDPVTVLIDLNGTAKPQQLKLKPRQDDPGAMPISYVFDGSETGAVWFRMVTVNNQARGADEVILDVEKGLDGNYRTARYVRFTSSQNGNANADCSRVQLAEIKVLAPSLTPLDGTPPARQLKDLFIYGESAMREGTSIKREVFAYYTDGSSENVTAAAVKGTGNDFGLTWAGDGTLTAADNQTVGDSRSTTLSASFGGKTQTAVINIYDTSVSVFEKDRAIRWMGDARSIVEGGEAALFKMVSIMSDNNEQPWTGAGSYSVDTPYPDGMRISTGANAIGSVQLPANSITKDFERTLRFTFSDGNSVTLTIPLTNVNEAPANRAPVLSPIGDQVITASGDQYIDLPDSLAYDPDGDTLAWSVKQTDGSALIGLEFNFSNPRRIKVPAAFANKQVAIRVAITDGELGDSKDFLLTVNRTVDNPSNPATVKAPTVTANKTMPTCLNDTVTLTASGMDSGATVLWSNGATSTSITVTVSEAKTYSVHAIVNGVSSAEVTFPVSFVNPQAAIIKVSKAFGVSASESVTFTADGVANGATVKWYKNGVDTGLRGNPLSTVPGATAEWKAKVAIGSCESSFSNTVRVTVS